MRTKPALIAFVAVIACASSLAQERKSHVTAQFGNGISSVFTADTGLPGAQRRSGGGVRVGEAGVDRYLMDYETGLYFGYNLAVERQAESTKLKVFVRPLSA